MLDWGRSPAEGRWRRWSLPWNLAGSNLLGSTGLLLVCSHWPLALDCHLLFSRDEILCPRRRRRAGADSSN